MVDRGEQIRTASIPSGTAWVEVDNQADLEIGPGDRVPLLARMLASPLSVDIRRGAVENLSALLHERYISTTGHVLVAVGASQGEEIWRRIEPSLPDATVFTVNDASLASAGELQAALGERGYDAVVGIGGGRTLDVAKYAATRAALPMVAVATNLAHDGLCSPVASLEHAHGKGSYGVAMPLAVVVDLDYVRSAPRAAGPVRHRRRGEQPVGHRGLAARAARARRAGRRSRDRLRAHGRGGGAAPHRLRRQRRLPRRRSPRRWSCPGMAMSVAGTSRPCSGACHEIIHAVDGLFPGVSNHGELAGHRRPVRHLPAGGHGPLRPDRRLPAPARPAADAGWTSG